MPLQVEYVLKTSLTCHMVPSNDGSLEIQAEYLFVLSDEPPSFEVSGPRISSQKVLHWATHLQKMRQINPSLPKPPK